MKIAYILINILTIMLIGASIFFFLISRNTINKGDFNLEYVISLEDKSITFKNNELNITDLENQEFSIKASSYVGDIKLLSSMFGVIKQGDNEELWVNKGDCNYISITFVSADKINNLYCIKSI